MPRGYSKGGFYSFGEHAVCDRLVAEGYTLVQGGWPDICAIKGDKIRLIEVKPTKHRCNLSPSQVFIHAALKRLGIEVEIIVEPNHIPDAPDKEKVKARKAEISKALSVRQRERFKKPAEREKMRVAAKAAWENPESRAKLQAAMTRDHFSEIPAGKKS